MVRNHNGYWMSPKFFSMAPGESDAGNVGGGIGGGTGAPADGGAGGDVAPAGDDGNAAGVADEGSEQSTDPEALNAEIARLKADLAKQKAAMDKATSEAGNLRKELRSKMTQEQIAAREKEEADEAQKQRIVELEKQVAKTGTVKSVMGKLGLSEEAAGNLADHLFGAADIENALLEIQKAWQARETSLRREYGKIPGPGAGADSNSPEAQAVKRAAELGKQRNAVNEQAQKAMSAYIR